MFVARALIARVLAGERNERSAGEVVGQLASIINLPAELITFFIPVRK